MNILDDIDKMTREAPQQAALKIPRRGSSHDLTYEMITFEQLNARIAMTCTYLFSQGIVRGTKVLVMVPPGEDLLVLVFSLLKAEAVPIVIDPGMGVKNFFKCVRRVQPTAFVACPKARFLFTILSLFVKSLRKKVIFSERLKRNIRERGFACDLLHDTNWDRTAAVLFTSGSTGHPKGAVYTYRQLNAQAEALQEAFHFQSGEVDLSMLPVFSLYSPILNMTAIVPEMDPSHPSAFNPADIVNAMHRCKVTNSFGSPRLWTKIADYCEAQHVKLPSLKRVFLAGAPVHPQLLRRVQVLLPSGQVYTPYGATEALPIACISASEVLGETYDQTLQGCGTCVGKPLPGVRVHIIPITNEPLAALPETLATRVIGEIVVQAPYVSESYMNDAAATQKAKIVENGVVWHRMGDVGYLDEQGRLWFCGRKVERVVSDDGKIYYTDCCEAIFNVHPQVFRSALIQYKRGSSVVPAVVIEPKVMPSSRREKMALLDSVKALGKKFETTRDIDHFFLYKHFPVDVRHNAKIHRLALSRYFSK